MTTVAELIEWGRRRLASAPVEIAGRETHLLLGDVLGESEARLLGHGEDEVSEVDGERYRSLIERRRAGEPAAYVLGRKEFYGRTFEVDPRVLIPRPETEHLVEAALEISARRDSTTPALRILDIGTGSGCLAITLALEIPTARVVATDISPAALAVAAANAARLSVGDRVQFAAADLVAALSLGAFDLVVSNPPYIAPSEADQLSPEILRHEPSKALFADRRGEAVIDRLLRDLTPLAAAVPMLIEIGYGQSEGLRRMTAGSAFRLLEIRPDYAGIPRIAVLRRR